ncbi:acyl-CoA dehydrogenase family protein [Mycobacterium sp.]|uniref:acyl-CoA dehydrogenase family protein n=1 Tax=Mycobacterium sp. TaxID=1785 RepID=UPI003BACE208
MREACLAVDEYLIEHHAFIGEQPPPAVLAELQKAKLYVTATAIDIVNDAMTVVGGAGYLNKHPISRLYRDVRAGQYMQPFSPIEGFEYLGKTAIGEPAFPTAN